MVEKVDLEITRFDLKPQIGQFRYLKPFFHPLIFYFSTGGKMVEKGDLGGDPRCDLKPQIFGQFEHLHSFFSTFSFSTFLLLYWGVKW